MVHLNMSHSGNTSAIDHSFGRCCINVHPGVDLHPGILGQCHPLPATEDPGRSATHPPAKAKPIIRKSKRLRSVDDQLRWRLFVESFPIRKDPSTQGGGRGGGCRTFADDQSGVELSLATLSAQKYMNYHHWRDTGAFSDTDRRCAFTLHYNWLTGYENKKAAMEQEGHWIAGRPSSASPSRQHGGEDVSECPSGYRNLSKKLKKAPIGAASSSTKGRHVLRCR